MSGMSAVLSFVFWATVFVIGSVVLCTVAWSWQTRVLDRQEAHRRDE